MKKAFLMVPVCLAPALALAGTDTDTPAPHESVLASVDAVRNNDLNACLQAVLSDEALAEMEREWDVQRKVDPEPAADAQFQMVMMQLTAEGAEDVLMAMLEPKLAEMRPQVDLMIGMFTGLAQSALDQDTEMDPAEKERARRVLDMMGRVLTENDITDPESARKSVEILCKAARRLQIKSLKDIQALSFEGLVAKGDVLLRATKDILVIYGIDLDEWMESVEAETISETETTAVVRVTYEMFGVQETFDAEMVRVSGRWIRKEAAELTDPVGSR